MYLRVVWVYCALLLSGCLGLPVEESSENKALSQKLVAHAYNAESRIPEEDVRSLAYFLNLIDQHYYPSADMVQLEKLAMQYLEDVSAEEEIPQIPKARLHEMRQVMLSALDRHSRYYNRAAFQEFQRSLEGDFVGIGVRLSAHELGAYADPLPNSPASRAGLQRGDIIIRAGAAVFKGKDLGQIVATLRGDVGTNVSIDIVRNIDTETEKTLNFSLQRQVVHIASVDSRIEDNVGYLNLLKISHDTDDLVEAAIQRFEGENVIGYVIDLRGNPGGFLQEAITLSDYFLDDGRIVSVRSRAQNEEYSAHGYATLTDRPIVVLIDRGTASSSEILAMALADHQRAMIIGEKSYGKGTVQSVLSLHDGEGIKLTIAKYFSPNGVSVDDRGIVPDIPLVDNFETAIDEPLAAAISQLQSM